MDLFFVSSYIEGKLGNYAMLVLASAQLKSCTVLLRFS